MHSTKANSTPPHAKDFRNGLSDLINLYQHGGDVKGFMQRQPTFGEATLADDCTKATTRRATSSRVVPGGNDSILLRVIFPSSVRTSSSRHDLVVSVLLFLSSNSMVPFSNADHDFTFAYFSITGFGKSVARRRRDNGISFAHGLFNCAL